MVVSVQSSLAYDRTKANATRLALENQFGCPVVLAAQTRPATIIGHKSLVDGVSKMYSRLSWSTFTWAL